MALNDRYCGASECTMFGVTRTPGNALHSLGRPCIAAKNKPGKEKWSSLPHDTEPIALRSLTIFLALLSEKRTARRQITRNGRAARGAELALAHAGGRNRGNHGANEKSRFSIDPDNPYGKGVCGQAIRSQKPAVNLDILNSEQARPWREANLVDRDIACAAFPLVSKEQSIGVLKVAGGVAESVVGSGYADHDSRPRVPGNR